MSRLTTERLLEIFALTLTPLLATGCARIDEAQFAYDVCNTEGYYMLGEVAPDSSADYLELRSTVIDVGDPVSTIIDSSGQACAGAGDAEACAAALAALDPSSDFILGAGFDLGHHNILAYTRADEVGASRTLAELQSFLGTIDSPGDAALLGHLTGHQLNCEADAEVGDHAEGFVLFTRSGTGCGEGDDVEEHVVLVRADGSVEVLETELIKRGDPGCAIGRLPAGLCRRAPARATNPVGRFLAEVATLEAAAVPAFGQLAAELVAHRAPASLVQRALRSRADEVRHARVMGQLARRYGGRPRRPVLMPTPPRSLAAVAEDNAIEGCVRETYGALVAHAQARQARSPLLRRAFASIAVDETRHAALSWELAQWADARLSPAHRAHVARKRASAVERLRVELTAPMHRAVHVETGLPEPTQARALFDGLERALA